MKIMIFNTLYTPYRVGGAEVSVQLLAEYLVKAENEVCVVTLHESSERKCVTVNGVQVIYLPLQNVYWPFQAKSNTIFSKLIWHINDCYNLKMYKSSLEEIKSFSPDIVHTNNLSGFSVSIWSAVKKLGIKLVHTSRDYYLFHPNSTLFKDGKVMDPNALNVKIWSWFKKYHSQKVDSYVGISNFIAALHKENGFFKRSKMTVIYNSVSKVEHVRNNSKEIGVGFLGRLTVEKGFDEFCKIAKNYLGSNKLRFVAAGNFVENDEKSGLEKQAADSNVEVLGYLPLEEFMPKVDIVVLPIKWNEPFGRTVVECALSGKTVYTSPVGSMPELSQIFSSIIISNSTEDISGSIGRLDPVAKESNGLAEKFSPELIAAEYKKVYSS